MKVKIVKEGGVDCLQITLPIEKKQSKSGKTTIVASSSGNKETDAKYEDKPIIVGVNAYIK